MFTDIYTQAWTHNTPVCIYIITCGYLISTKKIGLLDRHLPTPMTFSILMQDASISLANSRTAWLGSSYVKGSTYVLTPKEQTHDRVTKHFSEANNKLKSTNTQPRQCFLSKIKKTWCRHMTMFKFLLWLSLVGKQRIVNYLRGCSSPDFLKYLHTSRTHF